jgi:hypothetical protein
MISLKTASFSLAMIALAAAGSTQPASAAAMMKMSASNQKMMNSCMGMTHDAMMANKGCMSMMKKMKMSDSDMKMMMSCKAMSHDAMMADKDCMAMSKMHPAMMMAK